MFEFEPRPPISQKGATREENMREERLVRSLKKPIQKILETIRPAIEKGQYRAIIGDDASGRIPTLIMRDVIKSIYERKGYKAPQVRFVAGSSGLKDFEEDNQEKEKLVSEHMKRIQSDAGVDSMPAPARAIKFLASIGLANISHKEKVLIVTDTVSTGESVSMLTKTLKNLGISADVATIALIGGEYGKSVASLEDGTRVIYGQSGHPTIYGENNLSGVHKNHSELFAKRLIELLPESDREEVQQSINNARQVAQSVAMEIIHEMRE